MILDFVCEFCGEDFFEEFEDVYCQGKICCQECFEGKK